MMHSESYLDIVWKQFRRNRIALASLCILIPLFLIAVMAPLIASNKPLVYWDGKTGDVLFPWVYGLVDPDEPVDYVFNMAFVAIVPWALSCALLRVYWRRIGMPGRRQLGLALLVFLGMTAALSLLFLGDHAPQDKYRARTFPEEELASGGESRGLYALIPYGPTEQDLDAVYKPPLYRKPQHERKESNDGFLHLLGTDNTGRDVLVQMIYGARISMTVGVVAVSLYITIGVILGALAGYFGGWIDMTISRTIEIVLLFPTFFLILTIVGLRGPSIYNIMVVIGLTSWPTIARLVRGEVLKQRALDYVSAARGLGASNLRIIFRHILPNALSPVLVAAPFGIAGAIITEAGLSLLGVGVRPPAPTWGTLLRLGTGNYGYWWLVLVPSLAMFFTVSVFNLVGSGLRDAMDPRMRM